MLNAALKGPGLLRETALWRAAVLGDGGTVSGQRALLVNNLIRTLQQTGIWSNFDRIWLFAAENSQSALRDIKASAAATATGSPTFTANSGYVGASGKYIDTNFNPATAGGSYARDSASLFGWTTDTTLPASGQFDFIGVSGSFDIGVLPYLSSSTTKANMQSTTSSPGATGLGSDHHGLHAGNRSASNAIQYYMNGSSVGTSATASNALVSFNINGLRGNDSPAHYDGNIAALGFGSSLDAPGHLNLYNAMLAYMQAVGAA